MFAFLKTASKTHPRLLKAEFNKLLARIKHFEGDRHQTRAFAYLDIISWVESKVQGKTMSEVVYAKYLKSRHR
jgi:hypothetical protein